MPESSLRKFCPCNRSRKSKTILLVMDRAGWPMSERLVISSGIYVEYLPAYSLELQPAERLWSVTDEPLVNKSFDAYTRLGNSSRRTLSNFIDNYDLTNQKSYQLLLVTNKQYSAVKYNCSLSGEFISKIITPALARRGRIYSLAY